MRYSEDWKDYEVLATSRGEKLERWGKYLFLRPDPQIIWDCGDLSKTKGLDCHYHRTESKTGVWEFLTDFPKNFEISYKNLKFKIMPMTFKHMCLFPEQAVNWDRLTEVIKNKKSQGKELKVLNLFAYTGGASIACAKAGAKVTHVDAAKSMVEIAKENATLNRITNIRFIVDDCKKFVEREIRRGNKYDIIIMDPPSFGRGPNGETWKLEDNIFDFAKLVFKVLEEEPTMVLINSYTTGLQPTVMANILNLTMKDKFKNAKVDAYEVGLPTKVKDVILPCGCSAVIENIG